MNILGWRISFRRKQRLAPSAFAAVLPRVRDMREQCDWPPTTTPATQEQRRERVLQARRRILYRPERYEIASEAAPQPAWMRLLMYVIPFGLLAAAMAWVMVTSDVRTVPRSFIYTLPGAPTFLTESLALDKAKESLAQVVRDPNAWHPWQSQERKNRTAPDGMTDLYLVRYAAPLNLNAGFIIFTNAQRADGWWNVTVELRGNAVVCTGSGVR